jgi:hypothetical protein
MVYPFWKCKNLSCLAHNAKHSAQNPRADSLRNKIDLDRLPSAHQTNNPGSAEPPCARNSLQAREVQTKEPVPARLRHPALCNDRISILNRRRCVRAAQGVEIPTSSTRSNSSTLVDACANSRTSSLGSLTHLTPNPCFPLVQAQTQVTSLQSTPS